MSSKRVSIIIPVREINDYIRESIPYFQNLDYDDYEIIIFPDADSGEVFEKTRIIPSGHTGPAEKRDMAIQYATGDIFAFIDDDAFPRSDWLKNAVEILQDDSIAAVGGPAATVKEDDIRRQASGRIFESLMCSGKYCYRYKPTVRQFVDDLPTVNLLVKRDAFAAVGGFDSNYYPGEDTKLCHDIVHKLDKKIVYDPKIFVWHHRRRVYIDHLKQVANYAKHRGFFVKVLPNTSRKFAYFVPTLFVLGLILGPILSLFFSPLWYVYISVLIVYLILGIISLGSMKSMSLFLYSLSGLFMTHLCYGVNFMIGLLAVDLYK